MSETETTDLFELFQAVTGEETITEQQAKQDRGEKKVAEDDTQPDIREAVASGLSDASESSDATDNSRI
jgi:hypothetical protein